MFRKPLTIGSLLLALISVLRSEAVGDQTTKNADSQSTSNVVPERHAGSPYRRTSLDERVKAFAKALDLTETQQAGVKSILQRQEIQARKIQFDSAISGADRIVRFRALQQQTVSQIRALLNEEQKKKYDPFKHAPPGQSPQPSVEDWLKATQHPSSN